uniref:Uncharacterized protein n=1 Tax=viral metagenome TaxID=1070528 RepID=A0A6C0K3G6_9ZZZZ
MGFDLELITRATGEAPAPAFQTLATREDTHVALLEDNPTLFTKLPRGRKSPAKSLTGTKRGRQAETSGAKRGRPSDTAESPEAKRPRSKSHNSIYIHTDVMKLTWKEGEYIVLNVRNKTTDAEATPRKCQILASGAITRASGQFAGLVVRCPDDLQSAGSRNTRKRKRKRRHCRLL